MEKEFNNHEREIWRKDDHDLDSPRVLETDEGEIVIYANRHAFVKTVEQWHELAVDAEEAKQGVEACENARYEPHKEEKIAHYLHLLYEAQRSGHEVHKEIEEALAQFKKEAGI